MDVVKLIHRGKSVLDSLLSKPKFGPQSLSIDLWFRDGQQDSELNGQEAQCGRYDLGRCLGLLTVRAISWEHCKAARRNVASASLKSGVAAVAVVDVLPLVPTAVLDLPDSDAFAISIRDDEW